VGAINAGYVPGTGWPEPGGFLPREALAILKGVAKEGIAAMEAVEISPPYDISDITALIAVRAMVDLLATMVKHDRIGGKLGSTIG
jgi:agmatinase